MLGEEAFLVVVTAIIYWCINKNIGYTMSFALLFSTYINIDLKELFHTARPIGVEGIKSLRTETAFGDSFPSGHTQAAVTFWSSLALGFRRRLTTGLAIIIIALVGISRLYLGVHWPIDVIGGIGFGLISAYLIFKVFNLPTEKRNKWLIIIVIIPALIGLPFVKDTHYFTIISLMIGLFGGYLIEQKSINFEVKASVSIQLLKVLIGVIGIFAIKIVIKAILPETVLFNGIRYGLIGFWVTAGAPYMFNLINKRK